MNNLDLSVEKTEWGIIYYYKNTKCSFALYMYDDDKKSLYLSNVSVSDTERGKGIGNEILEFVYNQANKRDVDSLYLFVLENSWMHEWYKRKGFVDCVGRTKLPDDKKESVKKFAADGVRLLTDEINELSNTLTA